MCLKKKFWPLSSAKIRPTWIKFWQKKKNHVCKNLEFRWICPKYMQCPQRTRNRVFSLTWPASMHIYWNKRKRLHKRRVQLPQDWLGTPTWPPFHCFGTPIWPPWRHVKTLYTSFFNMTKTGQKLYCRQWTYGNAWRKMLWWNDSVYRRPAHFNSDKPYSLRHSVIRIFWSNGFKSMTP